MLPEDDRVIETCRERFKCFNVNFRSLNEYMCICWCIKREGPCFPVTVKASLSKHRRLKEEWYSSSFLNPETRWK